MCYDDVLLFAVNLLAKVLVAQTSNAITTIPANTGIKIANAANVKELPDSTVESTELPKPPVVIDDVILVTPVSAWIVPATPPPAIMASVHLRSGDIPVTTDAIKIMPATTAMGDAIVSRILSTHGM